MLLTCLFGKLANIEAVAAGPNGRDARLSQESCDWAGIPESYALQPGEELIRISRHWLGDQIWTWIGVYRQAYAKGSTRAASFYGGAVLCSGDRVVGSETLAYLKETADALRGAALRSAVNGDPVPTGSLIFSRSISRIDPSVDAQVRSQLDPQPLVEGETGLDPSGIAKAFIAIPAGISDEELGALIDEAQVGFEFSTDSTLYLSAAPRLLGVAEGSAIVTGAAVYSPNQYKAARARAIADARAEEERIEAERLEAERIEAERQAALAEQPEQVESVFSTGPGIADSMSPEPALRAWTPTQANRPSGTDPRRPRVATSSDGQVAVGEVERLVREQLRQTLPALVEEQFREQMKGASLQFTRRQWLENGTVAAIVLLLLIIAVQIQIWIVRPSNTPPVENQTAGADNVTPPKNLPAEDSFASPEKVVTSYFADLRNGKFEQAALRWEPAKNAQTLGTAYSNKYERYDSPRVQDARVSAGSVDVRILVSGVQKPNLSFSDVPVTVTVKRTADGGGWRITGTAFGNGYQANLADPDRAIVTASQ
ncbi:hypothetical protein ACFQ1E_20690 [Sphingomonas canadensis]|uniref:DUF4878 domain-containing protein n=1 Tax=Sphingomonas canadensis TaxID=1219257 RepID=A0ABW3HBA4_9SPHN|nr:hypothetical protein [Sphingomonas canadensis]MCW3838464.1 hypothetical protein [Sphingomonas canadensis]